MILVIDACFSSGSRAPVLAVCLEATLRENGAPVSLVRLRAGPRASSESPHVLSLERAGELAKQIRTADAIIVAAPVSDHDIQTDLRGFVAQVGSELEGKVVGVACAANDSHAYHAPRSLLSTLMLEYRCRIVPHYVYAEPKLFENGEPGSELSGLLGTLALEVLRATHQMASNTQSNAITQNAAAA